MLIRRPATRRKGTRRRVTHPRGTRRSRGTRLSTASLRRRSSNSNPAVPVAWKDVWLLSAVVAFWMHASDGEEGIELFIKTDNQKKKKNSRIDICYCPPLLFFLLH